MPFEFCLEHKSLKKLPEWVQTDLKAELGRGRTQSLDPAGPTVMLEEDLGSAEEESTPCHCNHTDWLPNDRERGDAAEVKH